MGKCERWCCCAMVMSLVRSSFFWYSDDFGVWDYDLLYEGVGEVEGVVDDHVFVFVEFVLVS